jgi:hypothetical protein
MHLREVAAAADFWQIFPGGVVPIEHSLAEEHEWLATDAGPLPPIESEEMCLTTLQDGVLCFLIDLSRCTRVQRQGLTKRLRQRCRNEATVLYWLELGVPIPREFGQCLELNGRSFDLEQEDLELCLA